MPISLPPLSVQKAISQDLAAIDDKIELNRRMNETLEAMAQAIFRDWFVDFGPVRRKLAGQTNPVAVMGGLTADPAGAAKLAALFPARLDEDGLPEGWADCPIGDQVEIAGGSTPSTTDDRLWSPAEHRWATPKDLSGMSDLALFETGRRISSAGLAKITSGLLAAGTVLLSSRAPIGYLAIAQERVAINQGFIALKPTAVHGSAYLYLWCKANMEAILANANGSTFQEISKKNFRPITSAVPADPAILRAFGEIAQPLIDRIVSAARENGTLAQTRDYLLPRLMSGQVRVGNIGLEVTQ
jgi:type I restriction enzyme S subunit